MELAYITDIKGEARLVNVNEIVSIEAGSHHDSLNQWEFLLTLRVLAEPKGLVQFKIKWDEVKKLAFNYNPYLRLDRMRHNSPQDAVCEAENKLKKDLFTWVNNLAVEELVPQPSDYELCIINAVIAEAKKHIGVSESVAGYNNINKRVNDCQEITGDIYAMLGEIHKQLFKQEWNELEKWRPSILLEIFNAYLPKKELPDDFRQYH